MDKLSEKKEARQVFRENIGENLREIRKKKGRLSVARIVDKINDYGYELSADTYYKWERGTRKPPCDAIPYIAKALGVSENMIFHLHEEKEKNVDAVFPEGIYAAMEKKDQALIASLMIRLKEGEKKMVNMSDFPVY